MYESLRGMNHREKPSFREMELMLLNEKRNHFLKNLQVKTKLCYTP